LARIRTDRAAQLIVNRKPAIARIFGRQQLAVGDRDIWVRQPYGESDDEDWVVTT
jgi:hypothetical protein